MKKVLILTVILALVFACTVTAEAEEAYFGLYSVTDTNSSDGVTVSPINWFGVTPAATTKKVGTTNQSGFYTYAEKVNVKYTNASSGSTYLVYVLEDGTTPTSYNLVYINGITASTNAVDFTIYQSRLESGKTYNIYIASNASNGIQSMTKVGSYKYYASGSISESQSRANQVRAYINRKVGTDATLQAYDLNEDGFVNELDVELARENC